MNNLKQMSIKELKHYLSEHRREEEEFSAALQELMSRDPNPTVYPADLPPQEIGRIMLEKFNEVNRK